MRMTFSLLFASVPGAALAHIGDAPHLHPHAVDGILALGLFAAGAVAIFAAVPLARVVVRRRRRK